MCTTLASGGGFSGPVVQVQTYRWIGASGVEEGTVRGHAEPCERVVMEVEGRHERVSLHDEFTGTIELYKDRLKRQRELRADIDATIQKRHCQAAIRYRETHAIFFL